MVGVNRIPVEFLREAFQYDPHVGDLIWKTRPEHHFDSLASMTNFNSRWAGRRAGQISHGYLSLSLKYLGVTYILKAHHVVWKLSGREFEKGKVVDHKNRIRDDNKLSNLRLVNRRQNNRNKGIRSDSTTGVTGVSRTNRGKYFAYVYDDDGKRISLGHHLTLEDATRACRQGELEYYGEFAVDSPFDTEDEPTSVNPLYLVDVSCLMTP